MKEPPMNDSDDMYEFILSAYAEAAELELEFLAENSQPSPALPKISDGLDFIGRQYGNFTWPAMTSLQDVEF